MNKRIEWRPLWRVGLGIGILVFIGGCMNAQEQQVQRFIDRHVEALEPLNTQRGRLHYQAAVSGSRQDFDNLKELQLQINELYLDAEKLAFLEAMKASGKVSDRRLSRQLEQLYRSFLRSRMDRDLLQTSIGLQTELMERYNNYRGHIDGRPVTMTDIYKIMTTDTDTAVRRKAWQASREVGPVIIDDFLRLVRVRNELARQAGYPNYHTYSLFVHEQSVDEIDALFAELDKLTAAPFGVLKAELDGLLAANYGTAVDDLRPWHYHDPFFQRTPLVYEVDLDRYYAQQDVAALAMDYFAGIGLTVDDIMARSDLYDKPGKNPHAFATDIDRQGDVRILTNIANDERWMETTLHELGHAVYFKYHDQDEPYLLRQPAHSFTTEAAAMFFGRLSRNAAWMETMLGLSEPQREELEKVTGKYLRFQQLLFARWALVMYNFEKALYADPEQDLNTLWWDLVERYQYVQRPQGEPDAGWASKLHFTQAPCYYHNYMLGELLASQWHAYLVENVLRADPDTDVSYIADPRVGMYFKDRVFGPGAVYHWNDMIRRSTGRTLSAEDFIGQFVR